MFDAMVAGEWELAAGVWQGKDLLPWKPARPPEDGFDTLDLTVDLVVAPDLTGWEWRDEDEYAHGRRLGIVSETEHWAVDAPPAAMPWRRSPNARVPSGRWSGGRSDVGSRPGPHHALPGPWR
ncbi:hypothetical protein AB0948_31810 [Streptomyces koyangensis]|uniref:hypothetical protein n=1 Tax=Streptomyces koyangensis TaxID=188770 RepID=UPI0034571D6D